MPTDVESGSNFIPQGTDFYVNFTPITRDGTSLDFATVTGWIFTMGKNVGVSGTLTKLTTGYGSGDFVVSSGSSSVRVLVRKTDLAYDTGTYYFNLYAATTSGIRITHNTKYLTINTTIIPSGG